MVVKGYLKRVQKAVKRLNKIEYRKIIWGLLKDYRDDEDMTLEKLLELIMAIQIPKETKNPYVALSTREDGVYH